MRFGRIVPIVALFLLLIVHAVSAQQQPDADGDGVPDSQDWCWQVPGTAQYHGCTAATFPDADHDGVGDPADSCVNQPGSADNSGCPAGVTPDRDLDGVPDGQDACPDQPGPASNKGCPPDADGDGVPDQSDACPQQAADANANNLGCPSGVRPRDSDGDGIPDLLDACPQQSGSTDLGGCPDKDGDGVPDPYDQCPDQPGESDLFGCTPVTTAVLPAVTAISASNAANLKEVAHLVVGLPRFGLAAASSLLALRSADDLLTYDLGSAQLNPLATVNTGWSGYPVAASQDGHYLATLEFPPNFSAPPFAQIRDGASGQPLYQIKSPPDSAGNSLAISNFAFDPVLPLLALAQTSGGGFTDDVSTSVLLWDVVNNRSVGQLSHPNIVINLAFSGDGTKLATDSAADKSMIIDLWDVGTQQQIASFKTTPMLHFIGTPMSLNHDGSQVALGLPDGSFSLWQITNGNASQQYSVQVFNQQAGEVVSAVAFSPDGSLVALAGGVPTSGGLTGNEQFPIFLLDAASGQTLVRLDGHGSLIRDLAFTRDGRFLVSAGDSSVKFWGVGA